MEHAEDLNVTQKQMILCYLRQLLEQCSSIHLKPTPLESGVQRATLVEPADLKAITHAERSYPTGLVVRIRRT